MTEQAGQKEGVSHKGDVGVGGSSQRDVIKTPHVIHSTPLPLIRPSTSLLSELSQLVA